MRYSTLFAAAPATEGGAAVPAPPEPRSHVPAWLMTIGFTLAFVGLGSAIYWGLNHSRGGSGAAAQPAAAPVENPAAQGNAKPHPLAKYLELAGMRFVGDKNKTEARFLLINHSEAEITNFAANVIIRIRSQKPEEEPVGTLSFKIADVGPNESKEVTAPLTTRMKIYELPDWQFLVTDLQITSPPAE